MIAGFPGETEDEFAETLAFIQKAGFLMIHVFPYSRRAGTVADTMKNQIPEEIKRERVRKISEAQAIIRSQILSEQIGTTVDVLFETDSEGASTGHTPNFIPVTCPTEIPLQGTLRRVRIVGASDSGCIGEICAE